MAVTTEKSTQVTNSDAEPHVENPVHQYGGRLRIYQFNFTQGVAAGDANSIAKLLDLPGPCTVLLDLSYVHVSAFGAARTLDIGWDAYTDVDGTARVAAEDGLASALDVSAAATINIGADRAITTGLKRFEGKARIAAKVEGGTIPAGATIDGWLALLVD
jgi:hypothetical protein